MFLSQSDDRASGGSAARSGSQPAEFTGEFVSPYFWKGCSVRNQPVLESGQSGGFPMQLFDQATNGQLLSALAGKPIGESLIERYGGLTNLAQASFDELQQVKGSPNMKLLEHYEVLRFCKYNRCNRGPF